MERVFCVSACVLTKKKKREEKNSKSLSGTNEYTRARRTQERGGGVTRRAHTHHQYHRHPRERDDAIRVRCNSHTTREEREREKRKIQKRNDYWIWTHDLSTRNKKTNFSTDNISIQKQREKVNLAPVVAVVVIVRLLLGGEDSRTRGERARFRVRGKGRHILTILFCVCNERGELEK